MRLTFLAYLFLMTSISSGWANEDPNLTLHESSSLNDLLTYAALHNPGLEAAFNQWQAALQQIPQAKSLPDPRLTYRYFIREIETRVGPQRQAIELVQTFPAWGKLDLAGGMASEAAQKAYQQYEATKRALFQEVKLAYFEYAYWKQAQTVTQENLDLLKHIETVARTRYTTAEGSHPDVIRAQVELGKLENRLRGLQDMQGPLLARLNAALNRDITAPLHAPLTIEVTELDLDDEALLTQLAQTNPQLLAMLHEIDRLDKATDLAHKQRQPDLSLGVSYVDIASSDRATAWDDNGKDAVGVMVSLNIPLWDQRNTAAERQAKYQQLAAQKQQRELLNQLQAKAKMALYQWRDAQRKQDLYANALLPKAQQAFKVSEQAFRSGKGSFLDLVDAQRSLLEFQLAGQRAHADRQQALAQIELLVGKELTQ